VTEGSHGSYAYLNDIVYHEPIVHPQRIIDTTGAGDGYTAAFIAVYIKTHNIKKAMSAGSSYAAKILSKIGAN
jgi:sugar/nucleoside kinase (ribokinase family)